MFRMIMGWLGLQETAITLSEMFTTVIEIYETKPTTHTLVSGRDLFTY